MTKGSGLKPVINPVCPNCGVPMKYFFKDRTMSMDYWVLSEESRIHLGEFHNEDDKKVREMRRGPVLHRYRKHARFPSRRRINILSAA